MKSEELEKICEGIPLMSTQAKMLAMENHPAYEKLTSEELCSMLKIVNLCTEVVIKDKEGKYVKKK